MSSKTYARYRLEGRCGGCGGEPRPNKALCSSCATIRNATLAKMRAAQDGREVRMKSVWFKYGVTEESFERMLEDQDGRCAICGFLFHPDGGRNTNPSVDHNHKTGQTRALLCAHCNKMLGFARENAANLLNAVAYLQHFEVSDGR